MEYGAIDLHKRESQIRIVMEGGEILDRRSRRRLQAEARGRPSRSALVSLGQGLGSQQAGTVQQAREQVAAFIEWCGGQVSGSAPRRSRRKGLLSGLRSARGRTNC